MSVEEFFEKSFVGLLLLLNNMDLAPGIAHIQVVRKSCRLDFAMIFKPEDFFTDSDGILYSHAAATRANKLFQEWLEKQKRVYGFNAEGAPWLETPHRERGLRGYIVCIEPIQKKCEKHEPVIELRNGVTSGTITPGKVGYSFFEKDKWFCSKCGVELVAEWRAK